MKVGELWKEIDGNNDGFLTKEEYITFSQQLEKFFEEQCGGSEKIEDLNIIAEFFDLC